MTEEQMLELWHKSGGDIYVYADLVADKEREACAKVCDEHSGYMTGIVGLKIRARGET